MKNKLNKSKKSGVTLTELIIAMAIFAMVTAPIIGMFTYSTRLSASAYKMTMASIIAQMKMEELIGLTDAELTAELTIERKEEGIFFYEIAEGSPTGFPKLREITVKVYDSKTGGNLLQIFTNIINTADGGFN
ncbi:MAG: prepilin-type N-terminal cleavage/methylation domain-containing protein [Oscillospiraceae bacterium]|nr:prepilin-type N-terminal cleavage/methylation domain-containing protein [Oscillospiraceae bacterium]